MCRMSASCTHVSALLHALAALSSTSFQLQPNLPSTSSTETEATETEPTPVTSLPCQWKAPKAKKDSTLQIASTSFEQHEYRKPVKRKIKLLEDFDPRPPQFRGQIQSRMPAFLESVKGEQMSISFLLDSTLQQSRPSPTSINLDDQALATSIVAFKETLKVSRERIQDIERSTREQRQSSLWFSARRYRITSSVFGSVFKRRPDTPPDNLVLSIIQPRNFSSAATQYGIENEPNATREFVAYQQSHGHPLLSVSACGFLISYKHPYLGTSPDGAVYDPSNSQHPFGFVEVKCPYTARNILPSQACSDSSFCCTFDSQTASIMLKKTHSYYCQVQGQMGIGERSWCDFVIYTKRGIHVQRIWFDEAFWNLEHLPKLTSFYDNCVVPEIVS